MHRTLNTALRRCQAGLTTVEYAVAGGLISVAIALAFIALGVTVEGGIDRLTDLF